MSDSRSVKLSSRLVHWVSVISVVLLAQAIFGLTQLSWADSALSGGNSGGSASASSDTSAHVSVGTYSTSTADSNGSSDASSHSVTGSTEFAHVPKGQITINTGAEAEAQATKDKLAAKASAWAEGAAADERKANSSHAAATSTNDQKTANVWSSDGSYANANWGVKTGASAYTPEGTTSYYNDDVKQVALSYRADGLFSLAISSQDNAKAYYGKTADLKALSSGDIRSIVQSAMGASAYADSESATAYARSELKMTLADATSEAKARGMSEAYASVRRDGGKLFVTVRAERNDGCGSNFNSRQKHNNDCMVMTKIIHLKKGGHLKLTATLGARANHHGRHKKF